MATNTMTPWYQATNTRTGEKLSIRRVRHVVYSYNACDGSDGVTPVELLRDDLHVVQESAPGGRRGLYRTTCSVAEATERKWYTTTRDEQGQPVHEPADRVAILNAAPTDPGQLAWMPDDGDV